MENLDTNSILLFLLIRGINKFLDLLNNLLFLLQFEHIIEEFEDLERDFILFLIYIVY